MFPMGSGVSKSGISDAPQGHHWSDDEHHFWCCQGSGIEAFARLADTIFWRRDRLHGHASESATTSAPSKGAASTPPLLFVLQLLPSTLLWREAAVRVAISGDYPGSVGGASPLRVAVRFTRLSSDATRAESSRAEGGGAIISPTAAAAAAPLDVMLRLPQWARTVQLSSSGGVMTPNGTLADAKPGSLLALQLGASTDGALSIALTPSITWEPIRDNRKAFASLHAALYGPLVLGGFTYAERALPHGASLTPVPSAGRTQLASLRIRPPKGASDDGSAAPSGCLVKRWSHVWVVRPDRTRTFAARPPAECMARATPIEDGLSDFPQAHGGGKGYSLDDAQIADACAKLDGCVLPEGVSAFASGKLYLMHLGASAPVVLSAPPPTVVGTRRGGTDAANAATWRLSQLPVGAEGGLTASEVCKSSGRQGCVYIESFETPGYVLTPSSQKPHGASSGEDATTLTLERVRAASAGHGCKGGSTGGGDGGGEGCPALQVWARQHGEGGAVAFENVGNPSHFLGMQARALPPATAASTSATATASSSGGSGGTKPAGATPPAGLVVPHRGAAISREWELILVAGQGQASQFDVDESFAEYAPASFWLTRPLRPSEPTPPAARPFLLMPLNEMQDEHYNVYWCRPESAAAAMKPPGHCV